MPSLVVESVAMHVLEPSERLTMPLGVPDATDTARCTRTATE